MIKETVKMESLDYEKLINAFYKVRTLNELVKKWSNSPKTEIKWMDYLLENIEKSTKILETLKSVFSKKYFPPSLINKYYTYNYNFSNKTITYFCEE